MYEKKNLILFNPVIRDLKVLLKYESTNNYHPVFNSSIYAELIILLEVNISNAFYEQMF